MESSKVKPGFAQKHILHQLANRIIYKSTVKSHVGDTVYINAYSRLTGHSILDFIPSLKPSRVECRLGDYKSSDGSITCDIATITVDGLIDYKRDGDLVQIHETNSYSMCYVINDKNREAVLKSIDDALAE